MYLLYADESGDPGLAIGATQYFVISGLVVNERHWNTLFQDIVDLRRDLKLRYGVPQRIVMHGYDLVNGHGDFHYSQYGLKKPQRFAMYRDILQFLGTRGDSLRILNVVVKKVLIKNRGINVFTNAWELLIQRFDNYLRKGGHLNSQGEFGLLFSDRTRDVDLRRLVRRMRAVNYIPTPYSPASPRNILVQTILDDPVPRESQYSYFVQLADLVAYALVQRDFPRPSLKQFGMDKMFDILDPVLLKAASRNDPQGIVYWPK